MADFWQIMSTGFFFPVGLSIRVLGKGQRGNNGLVLWEARAGLMQIPDGKRKVVAERRRQSQTDMKRLRRALHPRHGAGPLGTRSLTPISVFLFCSVMSAQSCLTLCDTSDCSPPGSSVHAILQAGRTLEWVAISSSRASSWPRDPTRISSVSCTGRRALYRECDTVLESLTFAQSLQPLVG